MGTIGRDREHVGTWGRDGWFKEGDAGLSSRHPPVRSPPPSQAMIKIVIGAVLALGVLRQAGAQSTRPVQRAVVRDSTPADAIKRSAPRRLPVTAELLRTAFHDDESRELFARARRARLAQDSSIKAYDATARQRMTARLGIGRGIERIAYRQESAYRVQWQQGVGAQVELTGARVGIPAAPASAEREALKENVADAGLTPIPYSPGQESLWIIGRSATPEVDDRNIVHPLAEGSEAYYTFASGDSQKWTLPNGQIIQLRELTVRPRSPAWNLAIGSLWFDVRTGQLVRAAYRLAAPMDLFVRMGEANRDQDAGISPVLLRTIKAIASPMRVTISGVAIEYGLFDGKYWLPRTRSIEGEQQISFARLPVEISQAFSYQAINGPSTLPQVVINAPDLGPLAIPDSLSGPDARKWRDSAIAVRRQTRKAFTDSLEKAPCDSTGYRIIGRRQNAGDVPIAVRYPCDVERLANSPDFSTPMYDPNDALFGKANADALIASALPFGAQAALALGALPKPNFQYGLSLTRYNRIEGFSTGLMVEQALGAGYVATLTGRIGTADREPNAELSFARTNLNKTISVTGYNRLVSANDWGNPLSFGSSVSALMFGRDEGFYYRATGAELKWATERGAKLDWRLFGEQQRNAAQRTDYSFGGGFVPNISATRGAFGGASVRWVNTTGADPKGLRTLTDLRVEAAAGDSSYGRAAIDVTLSRSLFSNLVASMTVAGGTSAGQLPSQRRWFLGGTQTIRGQSPDTAQSGNAFWMSRVELGADRPGYRLLAFTDLGWTGNRADVGRIIRPMSGAGVGMSMFDGLIRFDVARGFYPRQQTRVAVYLSDRF